jgi:SAM-dependent methyltransferase
VDSGVGERARQGRKFGPAAAEYEKGRPGYPPAVLDLAATALALDPAATVVDLGAGTGKLTRLLAERFARVVAVEPLPEMRSEMQEQLAAAGLPQVEVRPGTAERLPLAAGEAQAVFVAEAFHWFDGPAALAEAARVLTPVAPAREPAGEVGGGIVLLWNIPTGVGWDPPLPEPVRALVRDAVSRGGEPGGALLARGRWREAFTGSPFGPLRHGQADHEMVRDRDGVIAHAMSISSIAGLPDAERVALRARLRELLPEARYRRPLRAELYWARLAPWCDRCGEALAGGEARPGGEALAGGTDHTGCAAARALEPPRFCRYCRRRMKVQVLPAGWLASCVAHGPVHPPAAADPPAGPTAAPPDQPRSATGR